MSFSNYADEDQYYLKSNYEYRYDMLGIGKSDQTTFKISYSRTYLYSKDECFTISAAILCNW